MAERIRRHSKDWRTGTTFKDMSSNDLYPPTTPYLLKNPAPPRTVPPEEDHCFNTGPCEGQFWLKPYQSLFFQSELKHFLQAFQCWLPGFVLSCSEFRGRNINPISTQKWTAQASTDLVPILPSYLSVWEQLCHGFCPGFIGCSLWERQGPLCSVYFTGTFREFLNQNTSAPPPQTLFLALFPSLEFLSHVKLEC